MLARLLCKLLNHTPGPDEDYRVSEPGATITRYEGFHTKCRRCGITLTDVEG